MIKYPYTDNQLLNLDWFLSEFCKLKDSWEITERDWNEIKEFIDNYFKNLDVQDEIDNKIDGMVKDGEFSQILSDFLGEFNTPKFVTSTSQMNDQRQVYVLLPNKNIYAWNGVSFSDTGAVYGVSDGAIIADVRLTSENYQGYGIFSVADMSPNKIYGISSTITDEMISGLPIYGVNLTIITSKPLAPDSSTGYTTYTAIVGSSSVSRAYFAFSYTNRQISPWITLDENRFEGTTRIVSDTSYEELGIRTLADFAPNKTYAISSRITEEMISNLPKYGSFGTLTVFKPYVNVGTSTGYTVYLYSGGVSSNQQRAYIGFSSSNTSLTRWLCLDGSEHCFTVGKDKMYPTIQAAVDAASNGDTILIYPGTYAEQVDCQSKTLHFRGIDKNTCIITDDSGDYYTPPMEIRGGSIENLTIIENFQGTRDVARRPYCIHADFQNSTPLRLENLILKNNVHACIGIGVRPGADITVKNVEMITTQTDIGNTLRGAFYIHTRANTDVANVKVRLENCYIDSSFDIACVFQEIANTTCGMTVETIGNTVIANDSVADNIIDNGSQTGVVPSWTGNVLLKKTSHGNNVAVLNK